ncbi:MAG TPA: MarR family transcriptional regulator [Acidobacteriaceae bacterium]|nr:MarR family transcriptional regulator [Acidobacteriaceae bacterium]
MVPPTQRRIADCPEESLFLELYRAADLLSRRPAQLLRAHDLSPNQYNVLRILRGAPEGLPCGEIGRRMITRDPDITRLLARLEKRGLIMRSRESEDRRKVQSRISREGLALMSRLDEPVRRLHRRQLGHLGEKRVRAITQQVRACHPGPQ